MTHYDLERVGDVLVPLDPHGTASSPKLPCQVDHPGGAYSRPSPTRGFPPGVRKIVDVSERTPVAGGEHCECVVIGAGILGLSAAWSLARRGHEVVVLSAHEPGHALSGSKGSARIFRLSYPDPLYVAMALASQDRWQELERASDRELLHTTGQVSFGADLDALVAAMDAGGAPFEPLTAGETRARFPQMQITGPAVYEAASGVLRADACLDALLRTGGFSLRAPGGVRALEQMPQGGVRIAFHDGAAMSADVVLNCAGPGALSLVPELSAPVVAAASLQQVVYLSPLPAAAQQPPPIFIEWGEDMVYGLPVVGTTMMKLSHHTPGLAVDVSSIGLDDIERDDPALTDLLRAAAARLLPTFAAEPVATERCLYDNTVDTDFVIDRVGDIVIGCGTSGHGFKFGPLIGALLADLALGSTPSFDLARFSLGRSFLARGAGGSS